MATVTVSMPPMPGAARGGLASDIDPDALPPSLYLPAWRPWLALYGARIRTASPRHAQEAPAPIQALLPEELVLQVLSLLPVATLATAACVCQQWRALADTQSLWRDACLAAFTDTDLAANMHLVNTQHKGRWRNMYLDRPHMRFDGVYVSRNTYIKRGIVEWRVRNACHIVCYYRYYRFMPHGALLYRTSPEVVKVVAKTLGDLPPGARRRRDHSVSTGRWYLNDDKLFTKVVYPNCASTEIRTRLRLRSTVQGARNRLDTLSITSFDRVAGSSAPLDFNPDAEDNDDGQAEVHSHQRGVSTFVFVPWSEVNSTILNKGIDEMDVWLPG